MVDRIGTPPRTAEGPGIAGTTIASVTAAGLAAAMGVGRFAYTPLLPVMIRETDMSSTAGAAVATANYAGYLLGAVALSVRPKWGSQPRFVVGMATALCISEIAMVLMESPAWWSFWRLVAGTASAGLFVHCIRLLARIRAEPRHLALVTGIGFSGVGIGIAVTGIVVLGMSEFTHWKEMWIALAAITAGLLVPIVRHSRQASTSTEGRASTHDRERLPGWPLLLSLYFLEGVGYIIVGTFLVASVASTAGETFGPISWIVAGIAAAPATIVWTTLGQRVGIRPALTAALALQAIGAAIPAVNGSAIAALVAAALFGGTFMGITALTMQIGVELRGADAGAPLTALYGLGQMLGPVVVAPVLGSAFATAFGIAAAVVVGALVLTILGHIRHERHIARQVPHHVRR